jgi:predicted DNA-binding transcriptional regulator AlpA
LITSNSTASVRLLSWEDLRERGIKDSKPTIYRRLKAGKFPRPVYAGKSPSWAEHEIDAYIRDLIASEMRGRWRE